MREGENKREREREDEDEEIDEIQSEEPVCIRLDHNDAIYSVQLYIHVSYIYTYRVFIDSTLQICSLSPTFFLTFPSFLSFQERKSGKETGRNRGRV